MTIYRQATPRRCLEAEAIAGSQQGNMGSFEELCRIHRQRVYALCFRMTGNETTAEDLTQDALVLLYRKIATFRGDSTFSTWLHRLTVNVVLMSLRKKGIREISIEEALDSRQENTPLQEFGMRDRLLEGSIDRILLERSVACLPLGYRIIFILHDIEGYEHNEIARIMRCSIGNSKSQLHKARRKLRELLRVDLPEVRNPSPPVKIPVASHEEQEAFDMAA